MSMKMMTALKNVPVLSIWFMPRALESHASFVTQVHCALTGYCFADDHLGTHIKLAPQNAQIGLQ
jgi:hypothetical protein